MLLVQVNTENTIAEKLMHIKFFSPKLGSREGQKASYLTRVSFW